MAPSDAFTIDYPETNDVIQGSSFLVTVTYTGSETYPPTNKDKITATSKNRVVKIFEYGKPTVDVATKKITQRFRVVVGLDPSKQPVDITCGTTIKSSPTGFFKYSVLTLSDINPDASIPLIRGNPFVKDLTPQDDGKDPSSSNGGVVFDLFSKTALGGPIPNAQIPLNIKFGSCVRLYAANDDGTIKASGEIFPEVGQSSEDYLRVFYIQTDETGHATLKIFPKKLDKPYPTAVSLSVYFAGYGDLPASASLLFITEDISPSITYPSVYEMDGGNQLTPIGNSNVFHPMVPRDGNKISDKIFFMNKHRGQEDILLGMMMIEKDTDFNSPIFPIPYAKITHVGINHLYYYTVESTGNTASSEVLVYNLTQKGQNKPDDNVTDRNLPEPKVADGTGEYLSDDFAINLQIISSGDLKCCIPVLSSGQKTVIKGDVVGLNVYINGYTSDGSLKVVKVSPPTLPTKVVQQMDVDAGYLVFTLNNGYFAGFDSDSSGNPGIVYVEYFTQDDRYSHIWTARIDTVPPGRS